MPLKNGLPQVRIQLENRDACLYGLQTRRNEQEIEILLRTKLPDSSCLRPGKKAELIILEAGNVSLASAEITSRNDPLVLTFQSPVRNIWRRTSQRINRKVKVEMRGTNLSGSEEDWQEVTALDISIGGMKIYSRSVEIPEKVELRVWIPPQEERARPPQPVQMFADVRRRSQIKFGGVEVGLRFTNIDQESQEILRAYLQQPA